MLYCAIYSFDSLLCHLRIVLCSAFCHHRGTKDELCESSLAILPRYLPSLSSLASSSKKVHCEAPAYCMETHFQLVNHASFLHMTNLDTMVHQFRVACFCWYKMSEYQNMKIAFKHIGHHKSLRQITSRHLENSCKISVRRLRVS